MMIMIPVVPFGFALIALVGVLIAMLDSYDRWVNACIALLSSIAVFFSTYGFLAVMGWL